MDTIEAFQRGHLKWEVKQKIFTSHFKKNIMRVSSNSILVGKQKYFFSTSYSDKYVILALSHMHLGVDIEKIQRNNVISDYGMIFSKDELERIRVSSNPDILFTIFWTIKESLIKLKNDDSKLFNSYINKYSPTVICGVPKLFKLLLDATQLKEFDISNTRLLLSAGELLPVSVWQEWYMKYKKPIIEGYGSVEMMTNVISNTLDDYTPGSAGKLLDGYKGTIKKNGELVVEGDSISNKILGNIENYLKCYSTKDIFEIDSENKYWFKGRIDYIQKYNGIWLNPLEIEKIILEFNCFDDVLLIVDDLKLYCFIASELPKEKTIHKLKNIFRENFTTNIFPTNVILVKEIPRNNNGKKVRKFIDRGLWKEG
ncbi:AMP-binding protein [Streptococcus pseudoporcinus]|uniref:AMP-binding protein n=1 Tax=Streptococcus pseudoporcinus TaxID=361101 RepID=UPI0015D66EAD|nr:AMP-binding protein [Streptococcus pseudoporcinus]